MNDVNPERLTVRQKLGQLVMPRLDFRNRDALSLAEKLIRDFEVGGFIVFGGERKQLIEATKELQSISQIPLFFACDAERGLGHIVSGTTLFPFAMSLGAIGDEELVYRQARFIAKEMRACGLNLIFAPVVDVNSNPENPIINIRSYGDDPSFVSQLGAAFIRGCQIEGVLACAKHFPGHGGVAVDSHINLPCSIKGLDDLWTCDLIPFREAIKTGVSSIMVAHLAVPKVDPAALPATVSEEAIQGLLVGDLGFKGLIITDSLVMGALSELGREQEDVACLSLLAGCDVLLDPQEPIGLLQRLNEMAQSGGILQSNTYRAVEKIITSKIKWLNAESYDSSSNRAYGKALVEEIAHRSICRIRGGELRSKKARIYVLDVTESNEDISRPFLECLAKAGINCRTICVNPIEAEKLLPEIESGEEAAICLVFTSVAAWKGHTKLPQFFKGFLGQVSNSRSERVLVSFGSPYVVRGFEGFDTIICAFDSLVVCQSAVADVLLGRLEPGGRLPVKL